MTAAEHLYQLFLPALLTDFYSSVTLNKDHSEVSLFSPRFPSGLPKTIQSSIFGWVAWDIAICLGTFLHDFISLTSYRYA